VGTRRGPPATTLFVRLLAKTCDHENCSA